ncbi:DUF1854 domain-containing protein [Neobacillus kokaensis]|uniref:DUF1854 domain-containing protein n=1 Tax=Neobacillus kokaensis TaxID=2759023 RepID=A0ABQ3N2V5_9BACI|nr:DUF1854 domain-containing protein [Neobacillus kokaensis]GHH97902.1 hypothetical protein AM1BK_14450 [Neobacillus kokaensis]
MVKVESTLCSQEIVEKKTDLSEAARIHYLTPENTEFALTEGKLLSVRVDGELYPVVYLHCSFPHSNKRMFISVRTSENQEVGMVKSLDEFPVDIVRLLDEQIHMRYFAPIITKVINIHEEFGYSYWEAETTAGHLQFTVRRGGGNVKMVSSVKVLITDLDGNRFLIEDVNQLSEKEYRMVEMSL